MRLSFNSKSCNKIDQNFTYLVNYSGGVLSLELSVGATGKELFSTACTCLGVVEYWYFGLQYQSKKGDSNWVRPTSKVFNVIKKYGGPLYFQVKYFPEEISKVKGEISLGLIYEQTKRDVVSGAVFCAPETSILLGSYSLQADEGDWPCVDHGSLTLCSYLPPAVIEQYSMAQRSLCEGLKAWHKDHGGLARPQAQLEYMRVAQYLGMYGVNYFPCRYQGSNVWIGVHPKGISIFRDNLLVPSVCLRWLFIRMVHYSCRKFIVRTVLSQIEEYTFHMKNLRTTRNLFEFAVGYHHLYLRYRSMNTVEVHPAHPPFKKTTTDETFKETTEETCCNDTTYKKANILRRLSSKRTTAALPVVNEEEEALI